MASISDHHSNWRYFWNILRHKKDYFRNQLSLVDMLAFKLNEIICISQEYTCTSVGTGYLDLD